MNLHIILEATELPLPLVKKKIEAEILKRQQDGKWQTPFASPGLNPIKKAEGTAKEVHRIRKWGV